MPPRYAYWTIIAGGLPTAFRAAARDDILPTFARLKARHPDAQLRWFARGQLWDSPEQARAALEASRALAARRRARPVNRAGEGPARGRDWRPGGTHRDPRQQYKDAKAARNAERRRRRFERARAAPQGNRAVQTPARPHKPRGPRPPGTRGVRAGKGRRR